MKKLNLPNIKKIEQRICYIHVAKCGGTSFIEAIKRKYSLRHRLMRKAFYVNMNASASLRGSQILNEDLWKYRENLLLYFLSINSCRFVAGHFPYSDLAARNFRNDWKFVTLLRHPVDRWFSHYFFNRYKKQEHFKTDLSLNDYVESEDGKSLGILYHRLFCGRYEAPRINKQESYVKTIENIMKLDCVGVVEHIDKFYHDFKKCFGVKLQVGTKNKNPINKKTRSDIISNSIYKKVEKICEPDIKIYNDVVRMILKK